MLLVTVNYNQPELTDNLVNQLKRDATFSEHELIVIDNGSTKSLPESTTHSLAQNYYFGGALNIALDYFLNTSHEYMWFLSNDLLFHGPRITERILSEIKTHDLSLYSPSVTNAGIGQCHWRQMWNWGTAGVRTVDFIDFMAPVFRKDLAEVIKQFPSELYLGWGQDFYSGIVAQENNLRVGVSDNINITHLVSQTVKSENVHGGVDSFSQKADINMHKYFFESKYKDTFLKYREIYANYSY